MGEFMGIRPARKSLSIGVIDIFRIDWAILYNIVA
jgi:hypothetical protein